MPDMLVKLYALPDGADDFARLRREGVDVRRALAPEKHLVVAWVRRRFSEYWASECEVAFARAPLSCVVAVSQSRLVGFACYDATMKGFFGPTGVLPSERGRGIGRALLIAALEAMRAEGYGYAIIGGVGPAELYQKAVGATLIEGSSPGIYRGMLRPAAIADDEGQPAEPSEPE
ncbi:MAG: GNAT family N-acetyltransferase [Chloroflexi bacterium]|nr:GNAT family N-acetyltransferase [Chloroflexota bacterium]